MKTRIDGKTLAGLDQIRWGVPVRMAAERSGASVSTLRKHVARCTRENKPLPTGDEPRHNNYLKGIIP